MLQLKMKIKLPTIALAALLFAGLPLASSSAYVGISVAIAPPAIPVYEQPLCPVDGYLWTPGYWDYANFGYYWVPGVWVAPPAVGLLWTPGYWGYRGGHYLFNQGYWGPTVGFYGGINYGFGYVGTGYYGGAWSGGVFRYNTAVTRVNTTVIHNTYVNNKVANTGSRASFNGPGGATAKPTAQEQAAAKAKHLPPTSAQRSRVAAAKKDPALQAANNHGKPNPTAINRQSGAQTAAAAPVGGKNKDGKVKSGAAQATHGSQPVANAAQTRKATATHAPKAVRTKQNGMSHNADNAAARPHPVRHAAAPVAPHRPPQATTRRSGPAAHGRAPAKAEKPRKKNKRGPGEPGQ